jgi:hypothetical protein
MSFVQRLINSTFVLGTGTFGNTPSNQVTLSNLRTTCDIEYAGGDSRGHLDLAIYGMTLSMMNQLSTLGMLFTNLRKNSITVKVGDAGGTLSQIFQGDILSAWPDMQGAPDVAFRVSATNQIINSLAPVQETSINGVGDVATILKGLASKMNLTFQNNGVTAKINHPYYAGSAMDQAQAIVNDAGIVWDTSNGAMTIWNPGQQGSGSSILISKDTGLVSYPTYASNGLICRTLFNPLIKLGSAVNIVSDVVLLPGSPNAPANNPTPADGIWTVVSVNHHLSSMMPRGPWFSEILATPPGQAAGPITP